MKKLLRAGISACVLGSASACGSAAAQPVAYDWTGFYAGMHAGSGSGTTRHDFHSLSPLVSPETSGNFDLRGGLLGTTFGFNRQIASLVLGLEGDFSVTNIEGGRRITHVSAVDRLATIRGRAGFPFGGMLPYLTAGLAFGRIEADCCNINIPVRDRRIGIAAGVGIEGVLAPKWTAKLEYLHVDLGENTAYGPLGEGSFLVDVVYKIHVVRFGLNYQFSDPEPLAAKAGMPIAAKAKQAPGFNWTGFYAGALGGYGWGDASWVLLNDGFFSAAGRSFVQSPNGWLGGGQFGFNYQSGRAVVGLEASLAGTRITDTSVGAISSDRLTTEVAWLGTFTGRLGYAWDRSLLYAKAGYAAGRVKLRLLDPPGPGLNQSARLHSGWTMGIGVEHALANNWTVGLEYNYIDLGKSRHVASGVLFDGSTGVSVIHPSETIHTIGARLNYLFATR